MLQVCSSASRYASRLVAYVDAEALHLHARRALAGAELDPPARHLVERGDALGDPGRVGEAGRHAHDAVADADVRRSGRPPRPARPRAPTTARDPRGSGARRPTCAGCPAGRPARRARAPRGTCGPRHPRGAGWAAGSRRTRRTSSRGRYVRRPTPLRAGRRGARRRVRRGRDAPEEDRCGSSTSTATCTSRSTGSSRPIPAWPRRSGRRRGSWTSPAACSAFSDPSFASLPEAQQPKDRFDLVPPGFITHLELTDTLQPERQEADSDDPFYGPEARLAFCDERGIDVQFLNPTFLVGAFVQAGPGPAPRPAASASASAGTSGRPTSSTATPTG